MSLHWSRLYAFAIVLLLFAWWAPTPALAAAQPAGAAAQSNDAATHPQVMQQAANEVATAKLGPLQPSRQAATALPAVGGAGGGLVREVFGFAYTSSLSDPNVGYPSWNFDDLSTVAIFGLHINDDGNFGNDSGLAVWNSSQVTNLVSTAHSHGTKVVVTIILQDFSSGTPHMCWGLSPTSAATTVRNTAAEVRAKGVDGVNVDYEGLNGSCGGSDPSWARHNFTAFVQNLRTGLGSGPYLSVDTYGSSAADSAGFFDVPGIAASADSLFVMAYDMEYSNQSYPPMSCPGTARLRCLGPTAPLTGYRYNDTDIMAQYTAAIPASKVLLGVPYYGRKACVQSATANAAPASFLAADGYQDAAGESTYVYTQAGSYSVNRDANDPAGRERWDTWYNTQLNCTRELYWDDTTSLGLKYSLANRDGLRGVGIWTLSYGGASPELWATLSSHFGGWSASYDMSQAPTSWAVGQTQTFPVTVTNTGSRTWPSTGANEVDLDLHFATSSGGVTNEPAWTNSLAFSLPADVSPGGKTTVSVSVTAPSADSRVLEAEMIKEHEFWFDQFSAVNVAVSVWSAHYDVSQVPTNWVMGQSQTFPVVVTNTSQQTWPSTGVNPVDLDLHFASYSGGSAAQAYWLSSKAFSLPADVAPGQSATVSVTWTPPGYGHLVLEAEMIKEHEFWFTQFAPVNVYVAPPIWTASYDVSGVPTNWVVGKSQSFPVKVTNSGNQTWPSTGLNAAELDLHFASYSGGAGAQQWWLSSKAFPLPADVAPGQTVTVNVTWAPPGYGHLVLEAEMIKEHEFWFDQFAPVNVYVAPPIWSAGYDVSHVPTAWVLGQSQSFPVLVTNTGNQAWPSTGVNAAELDLHFASYSGGSAAQQYWLSSKAFPLPTDVAPGQTVTVNVTLSPPGYGHIVLESEMIKEHEFWFDQFAPVNLYVAPK